MSDQKYTETSNNQILDGSQTEGASNERREIVAPTPTTGSDISNILQKVSLTENESGTSVNNSIKQQDQQQDQQQQDQQQQDQQQQDQQQQEQQQQDQQQQDQQQQDQQQQEQQQQDQQQQDQQQQDQQQQEQQQQDQQQQDQQQQDQQQQEQQQQDQQQQDQQQQDQQQQLNNASDYDGPIPIPWESVVFDDTKYTLEWIDQHPIQYTGEPNVVSIGQRDNSLAFVNGKKDASHEHLTEIDYGEVDDKKTEDASFK
ncbi:uncharacterized protein KGF55_000833 [Candida pseudojiufengensis]|uniref:uncharacterized protein n=1 Tax=Candida pseudojiufengensis TaxID=497109 RepID=UPI0022249504|nr:uncharacterized protein KGF55_000833 [Candida pseudojiufengensis]KAI5966524.1 hypothetical protein KGF55_000833 [Candida pseudojiufengensis]